MQPILITGIGTGIGKTLVCAVLTEALQADYWKPVQAGFDDQTDSQSVQSLITNRITKIHPELYKLTLAASPHIAAKADGVTINLQEVLNKFKEIKSSINYQQSAIIIEGAGGLFVPLNKHEFVIDLIKKLNAKVILVSRNYLGSINHSLLTAAICRQNNLNVCGWIFNDQYLDYEDEIVEWSGYKKIASLPFINNIDSQSIKKNADNIKENVLAVL